MKNLGEWMVSKWRLFGEFIFPHMGKKIKRLEAKVETQAGLISKQYTQTCELKKDIIIAAARYGEIEESNSKLRALNNKLTIRNVILESKS